ncbi:hypothetical protein ABZX88_35805 [Kitasatospora aureofaciens]|uniref:hypothetical protein n=1 Tax=Kitasatospora aureofaciens TaxID=1894 RepID=UPI0033A075EE
MNDPATAAKPAPDPDLDKVLTACEERLPAPAVWSAPPGYPDSLALAVLDAIWSIGIRYTTTRGVISRYTSQRWLFGGDAAHDNLTDLLDLYDRLGGINAFTTTVGTMNRVSTQPGAVLKGEAVHQAATVLHALGIDTAAQFRQAQCTGLGTRAQAVWRAIPGQRSGISWRYLRMLLGVPDVKPDRMIKRFIATALGIDEQQLATDRVVRLVQAAAARHGAQQHALDHEIWKYQTSASHARGTEAVADLKTLAHAFIGRAFPVLAQQHVIPVSVMQPFVRVGHDYQGSDVMSEPEFAALEAALEQAYPARFSEPLKRPHAEFANRYIFSFLEAAIARCALEGGPFDPDSEPVARSVAELIAVLDSDEYTIHVCRAVSHITTAGDDPVQIGDVTVFPEIASCDLIRRTQLLIPAVPTAFGGDVPFIYAPPHALVTTSSRCPHSENPYTVGSNSSAKIDRFLLLARFLHAGTHQSGWEITGASTAVAPLRPRSRTFGTARLDALIQRVTHLSPEDAPAFTALSSAIDEAVVKRGGMVATSFDTAVYRYNRAHEAGDHFERVVDLATALEAVLTGDDKGEGLSLRLRSRAAALLATRNDTGTAIHNDITKLYDLRSRLIHGGNLPEKDLRKTIMGISTVADDAMFGVALAFAVDRMRDLTRRAFLARLFLASGTAPLWPFGRSTPVDAALADDTTRLQWRAHWRDRLHALGAGAAADPAAPGIDPITRRSQT